MPLRLSSFEVTEHARLTNGVSQHNTVLVINFMRSYPNLIPLPASAIRRIVAAVEPFAFERIYGAWWDTLVAADAKAAVQRSAERYIRAVSDDALPLT